MALNRYTTAAGASKDILWQQYRQRSTDRTVENDLIKQYSALAKRIVVQVARNLPPQVDTDDLYSAGMIGLLHAIRQYDYKMGTAFEAYASFRIRGAVLDELRSTDWASRSMRARIRRVQAIQSEFENMNGRLPTEDETAEALNMPLRAYREIQDRLRPVSFVSLDAMPAGVSKGLGWKETIADPRQQLPSDEVEVRQLADRILQLDQVSERQKQVLELHYFDGLRFCEIAQELGITESRISQLHTAAMAAIRAVLKGDVSSASPVRRAKKALEHGVRHKRREVVDRRRRAGDDKTVRRRKRSLRRAAKSRPIRRAVAVLGGYSQRRETRTERSLQAARQEL